MIEKILFFIGGISTGYALSHIYELKGIIMTVVKVFHIPSSLNKVSKYRHELKYKHQGCDYTIVLPIRRGPKLIKQVCNEHNIDITEDIKPYMGPNQDFHNTPFYPSDLDCKVIHFHTLCGDILTFKSDQPITI